MSHVFISYSQVDADFASVMMTKLEKAGLDTWFDRGRLRPGSDWSEEIDSAIFNASALILVMSPDSRASEYVTYEWSFALGASIRILPLLLRDTEIHPRLRRLHYLDFRSSIRPWDELVSELTAIRTTKTTRWVPPRDAPPELRRAIADLDSSNPEDRQGAINVLAESDNEVARTALHHALAHPLRDVRARTAIELGDLNDDVMSSEVGLLALKDALGYRSTDEKDATQRKAHGAFTKIGKPAYKILTETAKSVTDPARLGAVRLLGAIGGEEAIPNLIELLKDSEDSIVQAALDQLGNLKAQQAADAIMRLLTESSPDEISKRNEFRFSRVAKALCLIGSSSIMEQLVAATKHRNAAVRMTAAQVLGALSGPQAVAVLSELLDDNARAQYTWCYNNGSTSSTALVHQIAAKALDLVGTADALSLLRRYRQKYPPGNNFFTRYSID